MTQTEYDVQLKVWKDLAINKQILIKTATDALKLSSECSTAELKAGFEAAIKKANDADLKVKQAEQEMKAAIAEMEKQVKDSAKAAKIAEASKIGMQLAKEKAEQQVESDALASAIELKKVKAQFDEKDKALKAINKALADTPENVMKKMRTLKKQKTDEANSRKLAEGEVGALRKEKRQSENRVTELQDSSAKLIEQHRNLHELCNTLHEKLTAATADDDVKDLPVIPELDDELIESLEKPVKGKTKK